MKKLAYTKEARTINIERKEYIRSEFVKEFALRVAEGYCQLCRNYAPFINKKGQPFLEVHHIDFLSKGGLDAIDNVIALCPNCHRKMHANESQKDISTLKKRAEDYARR